MALSSQQKVLHRMITMLEARYESFLRAYLQLESQFQKF